MSYIRPDSPLPQNSQSRVSPCQAARAKATVDAMENAVAIAYAASQQIAGPDSFRSFGPAVVIDVARSQNAMAAANDRSVGIPAQPNVRAEMMSAPVVLPLNVSVDEYASCCQRGTDALAPIQIPAPHLTMPPMMPARVVIPPPSAPMAAAPKYSNLCWALRNGAVDASQFDPPSLQALQYKCMQMGYTGACFPPANVALYLDQNRRAGTLPHITVNQADLDTIPQAPPLTGQDCPTSWKLAGMGMAWGNSAASRCPRSNMQIRPGTNWHVLALMAVALGVGYAVTQR